MKFGWRYCVLGLAAASLPTTAWSRAQEPQDILPPVIGATPQKQTAPQKQEPVIDPVGAFLTGEDLGFQGHYFLLSITTAAVVPRLRP